MANLGNNMIERVESANCTPLALSPTAKAMSPLNHTRICISTLMPSRCETLSFCLLVDTTWERSTTRVESTPVEWTLLSHIASTNRDAQETAALFLIQDSLFGGWNRCLLVAADVLVGARLGHEQTQTAPGLLVLQPESRGNTQSHSEANH